MVTDEQNIGKGSIIWINFNPTVGHEQGSKRPALVIGNDKHFQKTGMTQVLPITSQSKGYPFEVPLPDNSDISGVILTDNVQTFDLNARGFKFVEITSQDIIDEVDAKMRALLDL